MNHETIAALLPLSAAGMLNPAEERAVREHVRECAECAARLEELAEAGGMLGSLPAVVPPADLVLRTQARVAAELAVAADRKRGGALALAGAGFGWLSWLAIWSLYRVLTGGWASIVQFDQSAVGISAGISVLTAVMAASIAAAVMRTQRRAERRMV
jgi:predicted anti-sigma-YlaC factor YlaD